MRSSNPDLLEPVTSSQPDTARPVRAYPRSVPDAPPRTSLSTPEPVVEPISGDTWVRQPLQRGAPQNFRRHLGRAALRVSVLVGADLATFDLLRTVRRMVTHAAASGPPLARSVSGIFPQGYLSGWQFAFALVVGLLVTGNYGTGDRRRDAARLFAGAALATALPLWASIWSIGADRVLLQYVITTLLVASTITFERHVLDLLVARLWHRRAVGTRTLQVICARDCITIGRKRSLADASEFRVIDTVAAGRGSIVDSAERMQNLSRLLSRTRAEAVAVCDHLRLEQIQFVADAAMAAGCQLLVAPAVFDIAGVQPKIVWRRGDPLVELTAPHLIGQQLIIKRMIDLVGASIGLVLSLPALIGVAIAVRLDSRGAIFFSQERVGRGGRLFRIHKFRTMVEDAENLKAGLSDQCVYNDSRLFKVRQDPRVTNVGRFLRRSSLDELPQLWNVLKGEMSLVGPRPPLPSEVEHYEARHYVRFDVKPGITGPWQVAGRNMITDFEKVIELETAYIREWSIGHDIAILLRTIDVVLRMRGAH